MLSAVPGPVVLFCSTELTRADNIIQKDLVTIYGHVLRLPATTRHGGFHKNVGLIRADYFQMFAEPENNAG